MQLAAHLSFNGNCRQAFEFYARTLGGRIIMQLTYGEAPASGDPSDPACAPSADMRDRIVHARLDLDGQYLMGADAPPGHYHPAQGVMLCVSLEDLEQAKRTFAALSGNGKITMPFQETFWARGFGMCADSFGVQWMVNCEKPQVLGHAQHAEQRPAYSNA